MNQITVREHTRKPRAKSPAYIAKHEALRADVARDQAQRAERAITAPVVKVETPGSSYAHVWKSLAKAIGLEGRV